MLVRENISTGISRAYNNNGSSVLICKGFNRFKINLPTFFWYKIKMAYFKLAKTRP